MTVAGRFWQVFLPLFFIFGSAHLISYLYRTVNTILYNLIIQDIPLTANQAGFMTGAYFLSFALAQLPIGVALDKYGPRKVQIPLLFLAIIGSLIFATANGFVQLLIGRLLIGFGVAGCLMSAFKACSIALPSDRLAFSSACLFAIGGLGSLVSTVPLQWLSYYVGWRGSMVVLSFATLLLIISIARFGRQTIPHQETSLRKMWLVVGQLYCSKIFWRAALCTLFSNAIYMTILSFWVSPWLRDHYSLTQAEIAQVLFFSSIAMVAGSVGFGFLIDRLQQYGVQPLMVCGCGVLGFIAVQVSVLLNLAIPAWLLVIIFALFGTSSSMNYSIVVQLVPKNLSGRVSTAFNMAIFLLVFFLQWLVGVVLDLWPHFNNQYHPDAYTAVWAILILLQVPGIFFWLGFKPWQRKYPVVIPVDSRN